MDDLHLASVFYTCHHFLVRLVITLSLFSFSSPPPPLTLLLDLQYQVISLQGGVSRDMDSLNGPSQWGVDHRLHLHG